MNEELIKLRISVARVAQVAGVSLAGVGLPDDAGYTELYQQAHDRERGWNALAGETAYAVARMKEYGR